MNRKLALSFALLCTILAACGDDDDDASGSVDLACPAVVADADCDQTQRPFVFVHGTFGSGDNFAHVARLLGSNGFCQDRIIAVEYNSLGDEPGADGTLDAAIDQILADTGFTQVDLAGHSQGTRHCGEYLNADPAQAAKVAHYINFSGSPDVGDVETLSISSENDLRDMAHHATGSNVTAVTLVDEDHFAVAASTRAFVELYKYLRGEEPQYTEVQCGEPMVTVEGIAESFADNVPARGTIEVREVGDSPGAGAPVEILMPDATGHFGPIQLKRGALYEFKGFDEQDNLIGYQYFTQFKRSNRLVRVLSPSANPAIAAASTGRIVRGPGHTALIGRWDGGGFRQDLGASLTIDGEEVLSTENAGEEALASPGLDGGVVGLFMYDADTNAESELGLVASAPFLSFTDVFMDASELRFLEVSFTAGSEDSAYVDQKVKIPTWPSEDALILVMFQ